MLTWINFLHLYQPPTQDTKVLDQMTRECYARIPELFSQYPNLRLTINFSGSLLELLQRNGYVDVLKEYAKLAQTQRIELVGSAMYHPILPLVPEDEVIVQIKLQNEICRKFFGSSYAPKGFFLPEMAYSLATAQILQKLGFEWIILDEINFPEGKPDNTARYIIADTNLSVLFRDRVFSKTFPPEFIQHNKHHITSPYLITAHDGELYGHWHKDDKGYYKKTFTDPEISMLTISEYLQNLSVTHHVVPREASWESTPEELEKNIPFALWNHNENEIHKLMWEFSYFVLHTIEQHQKDAHYQSARTFANQGLASCAWWWATGAKLVSTSPVCWNPTEIEKGARQLLTAIRTLSELDTASRLKAEEYFRAIHTFVWNNHWNQYYNS